MNYLRLLLLTLLLTTGFACSSTRASLEGQTDAARSPGANETPQAAAARQPTKLVPTTALSAEPIRITPAELPQPFASDSASKSPDVIPIPQNPSLRVPKGFTVNVYAENLDAPRWLALTPSGDVLVTETRQNRIQMLRDNNGDGVADVRQTFANDQNGVNIPFGMAFAGDSFFLGNTDAVLRFPYTKGQQQLSGNGQKIADLPGGGYNQHWTRNVVASPDGQKLYVSVGSESNVDEEPLPRASVQVMNLDGSNQQTFASGLRNPIGLDFHPTTKELYTTVNERDKIGDDLVPDYFTRLQQGQFYGWPYAYLNTPLRTTILDAVYPIICFLGE